ncbi:restriction endonuclease subunit S [Anaerostipes butyraticus]|uniref:HsdS specificity protein of type I restriction-modification system n=1 Tax=Anaerostipes butyraticus TaxID=645466 RepID=A0A916QBT4_9FIRM|nr:restriction endonuclease subunit S [Anaerostipes butyraticus]GFO86791.1 HsdS specificity protein of type I restriction-modification system [Anaerostipes butyraticus]
MDQRKQTPQVRFKGYTDTWEQRKLGEIFVEYSEKNHEELPALMIVQGAGTIIRDESDRNLMYDKANLSNYKLVREKDFIVHLRSFEGGLEMAKNTGIISPAYHTLHGKGTDSRFYYSYFRSKKFIDCDLKPHVYGIRDGRSIDIGGMKTIQIPYTNFAEQKAIGDYIEKLDNLITIHQRKYTKLFNLKKAMLEKMFPQNGCLYPEIRFKGFTDAWEQRKLSELAEKTYGGGTPATSNEVFWNGNIPWIQSSDVVDGKLFGVEPRKHITQEGLNNSATQLVPQNSIAIITRVGVGKLAFMPFPYTTSQDFLSLSKLNTEPFFTVYACYKKLQSELNAVQGTSIKGITKDELLAKIIMVPEYAEQQQIGAFFRNIDNLITLHQRKLEKLKQIKKSCLEKMFV